MSPLCKRSHSPSRPLQGDPLPAAHRLCWVGFWHCCSLVLIGERILPRQVEKGSFSGISPEIVFYQQDFQVTHMESKCLEAQPSIPNLLPDSGVDVPAGEAKGEESCLLCPFPTSAPCRAVPRVGCNAHGTCRWAG